MLFGDVFLWVIYEWVPVLLVLVYTYPVAQYTCLPMVSHYSTELQVVVTAKTHSSAPTKEGKKTATGKELGVNNACNDTDYTYIVNKKFYIKFVLFVILVDSGNATPRGAPGGTFKPWLEGHGCPPGSPASQQKRQDREKQCPGTSHVERHKIEN